MSDSGVDSGIDPGFVCAVCMKEPAVGCACVPGIPMSVAFGRICLNKDAQPFDILKMEAIICGGAEKMNPIYLEQTTYVDGLYMSLGEALAKYPIKKEDLEFG
jgi:hypothetical protein